MFELALHHKRILGIFDALAKKRPFSEEHPNGWLMQKLPMSDWHWGVPYDEPKKCHLIAIPLLRIKIFCPWHRRCLSCVSSRCLYQMIIVFVTRSDDIMHGNRSHEFCLTQKKLRENAHLLTTSCCRNPCRLHNVLYTYSRIFCSFRCERTVTHLWSLKPVKWQQPSLRIPQHSTQLKGWQIACKIRPKTRPS